MIDGPARSPAANTVLRTMNRRNSGALWGILLLNTAEFWGRGFIESQVDSSIWGISLRNV